MSEVAGGAEDDEVDGCCHQGGSIPSVYIKSSVRVPNGGRATIAHMKRQAITIESSSRDKLPLSPAIVAGDFVFVSGQVAVDPETNRFTGGDTAAQTRQVIKNLRGVLERAGSSLDRVVKVSVFLTNIDDFAAFNEVYRSYFAAEPPARTTVQAGRLLGSYTVEIDAIAIAGE